MSAIINQSTDNTYIGNLKSTTQTVNGVFVTPNYGAQSATPVADATAGDKSGLLMVYNQNYHIDQELVADADFTIKADKFLRLKPFLPGNSFTTDQFTGDISTFNENDIVAIGAGGKLVAVASRTPAMTFVIKEKTTLYGKPALKVQVVTV
ncbi:hypothetical protein [Paenibacillus xylanexedens]|uniref:hypothetical protein n=1 Tax=Paenibacillus xylanexedens TaxID=528191 RepID=UPI0011A0DEBE|nr:hypothetical protein [Paenibacillus xylanexedens]